MSGASIITHLSSESTEEGKYELGKGESKVLVEEVSQESGHSMVGPATMDQNQSLQIPTSMESQAK